LGGRADESSKEGDRRKGAGRVGRYLEVADGDGLVGPGDADEGVDRLLLRPRHGGRRGGCEAEKGEQMSVREKANSEGRGGEARRVVSVKWWWPVRVVCLSA
jgi:hypothetical protein